MDDSCMHQLLDLLIKERGFGVRCWIGRKPSYRALYGKVQRHGQPTEYVEGSWLDIQTIELREEHVSELLSSLFPGNTSITLDHHQTIPLTYKERKSSVEVLPEGVTVILHPLTDDSAPADSS